MSIHKNIITLCAGLNKELLKCLPFNLYSSTQNTVSFLMCLYTHTIYFTILYFFFPEFNIRVKLSLESFIAGF